MKEFIEKIFKGLGNKKLVAILILIFVVLIEVVLLTDTAFINKLSQRWLSLEQHADQVIEECADASYRPGCYDIEVPKLMDYISMEKAFEVARIIQSKDSEFGYCHVLGHNLGGKEASKDPENWKDVISRCPRGICSSGCIHGAAMERFEDSFLNQDQLEEAKAELMGTCEDRGAISFTGLEKAECYHGLGHLAMYLTDGSLEDSIGVCDTVAVDEKGESQVSLCYEGMFMQLFQPLDEEDIALVEGLGPQSKEEARPFCESFKEEELIEACWSQAHPFFRENLSTIEGILEYCDQAATEQSQNHCYSMSFYGEAQGSNYDQERLTVLCSNMPEYLKVMCFGDVANAIIHGGFSNIERAVGFCSLAPEKSVQDGCYERIIEWSAYNIPVQTDEFSRLCNSIPEEFQDSCWLKNEE